jgi:hypothetical protein
MTPAGLVEVLLEGNPLPPTWLLSVWGRDSGMPPGYAQVDMIDDRGVNHGSTNLSALARQGYDVPDVTELATGQYFADLTPVGKQWNLRKGSPEQTEPSSLAV